MLYRTLYFVSRTLSNGIPYAALSFQGSNKLQEGEDCGRPTLNFKIFKLTCLILYKQNYYILCYYNNL